MSNRRVALCSGANGQVCSFLMEELLNRGYEVHGIIRRTSSFNTQRIDHILDKIKLHYGDLTDSESLSDVITTVKPTHFFNLGAFSHVGISFKTALSCHDITGTSVLRLLEILRKYSPDTRFVQSSTSEMFGGLKNEFINESTPFYPKSPYAASKTYAFHTVVNHRESYNLFAVNLIMFNCESERRSENFVTKKIIKSAVEIKFGLRDKLLLGSGSPRRDFGFAGDYADAFIKIAEADKPDDFIVASGENHSVKEFVELVFAKLDLDYTKHVEFDCPQYIRPAEVNYLLGDATKIKTQLGWQPKYSFNDLVNRMIAYDLKNVKT